VDDGGIHERHARQVKQTASCLVGEHLLQSVVQVAHVGEVVLPRERNDVDGPFPGDVDAVHDGG
jgi:hypothetical protein